MFVLTYKEHNNETLRKLSATVPTEKSPYSCIKYYRCQHKTFHQQSMDPGAILGEKPSKRFKNNDCPFSLVFRIKKMFDEFPCVIDIEWNHNHAIQAGQSYSFEDIPSNTIEKIKTMYDHGYTAGLAYRELLKSLKNESKDELEFHFNLSHRSKMPRRRDFNQIYTQYKNEKYGSKDVTAMFSLLKAKIEKMKEEEEDFSVQFNEFNSQENSPFILTFITPLMKRVHTMAC